MDKKYLRRKGKTGMEKDNILPESMLEKKNKKRIVVIIGILVLIAIMICVGISIYNKPENRLERALNLGQKYLQEMDYEQAEVAFNKAIEIDPKNAEAYLGLIEAYTRTGELDMALENAQKGYEMTRDERLKKRIDEIERNIEEAVKFTDKDSEEMIDNTTSSEDVAEIIEIIRYAASRRFMYESYFLTYEQLEDIYWSLSEILKKYLGHNQNDKEAWEALAWIYLHMGEMELCLEVREEGYEITGCEITGYEKLLSGIVTTTSENADITYDE